MELNIAPRIKKKVVKECEAGTITATLFDDVKEDIVIMIARDKLKRFVEVRREEETKQMREILASAHTEGATDSVRRLHARFDFDTPNIFMSPDLMRGSLGLANLRYPPVDDDATTPLPRQNVGAISCHGRHHGKSKTNQDRALMSYPLENAVDYGGSESALFVMADGHGPCGHQVADYVVRNVWSELVESVQRPSPDFEAVLVEAFVNADDNLKDLELMRIDRTSSGATCLAALVVGSVLYVAGCGDGKIVMGRVKDGDGDVDITEPVEDGAATNAYELKLRAAQMCRLVPKLLTKEHKISDIDEAERVQSAGGIIEPAPGYTMDRIWFDTTFSGPGLQPTRTIGDHAAKRIGVIATPDTAKYEITSRDKFVIIGTDGLWEYVTEKQAVRFAEANLRLNATKANRAELAATYLMNVATMHWSNEGNGYADDISVTIFVLPPWGPAQAATASS